MAIQMIVGLGNPGAEYAQTRHNLGFWLIDAIADLCGAEWKENKKFKVLETRVELEDQDIRLFKPQAYMNRSGEAMSRVSGFYKIPAKDMLVVYDDINLELGRVKVNLGGSAGGHNGVRDLVQHFGAGFVRFRLGIGGKAHKEMELTDHVLGKLTSEEKVVLTSSKEQFINNLKFLLREGVEEAMKLINQRTKREETINEQRETEL